MKRIKLSNGGSSRDMPHWSRYFTYEEIDCVSSLLLLAYSDPLQSESSENHITNEGDANLPSHDVVTPNDVQVVNTSIFSDTDGSGLREKRSFDLNESPRVDMNVSDTGGLHLGDLRPFDLNKSPRLDMNGSPSLSPDFDLNMPPPSSFDEIIVISSDDDDDQTDY